MCPRKIRLKSEDLFRVVRSVKFIEEHVFQNICPPEDTAGIILEPIASLAGEVVPPFQFIKDIKRICDKYDIFLISDEVKAGFGRTGKLFAFCCLYCFWVPL